MSIIVDRLDKIKSNLVSKKVNIIAVSKTFSIEHIQPLINVGHVHFGENKVQEADSKWRNVKVKHNHIQLHMIGKLQSNKAKKAVELFDYIHSLDNQKLALNLDKIEKNTNKKIKYFIQVNIGMEKQKSGIMSNELDEFYNFCTKDLSLNIIGLMTIPPNDMNVDKHFQYLHETNAGLGLSELSMGMSADYKKALEFKATFLRIGSLIFGSRN
mgnify:FL=1